MIVTRRVLPALLTALIAAVSVWGQQVNPDLYQSMRWRMIGPFRGGRTVGATGVPSQPNVFYIGVNNGGVWKTTDYGHTWKSIFDDQPTGSIGALAVAPSNPQVIYVGSGEGIQRPDLSTGDGIYKSIDGGKTWEHLGLRDGQQIGAIIVDPNNADRVFVAVLGHPYGANEERGVFRSTDGGRNWEKVLYKDENTGAIALAFDPSNPQTIYADLWAGRQGPWENGAWQGPASGLFKSTDGGTTWRQLTKGLPTFEQGLGRIGFAIAPTDPNRIYATVDANPQAGGIYVSNDAGESWTRATAERRIWARGSDFAEVRVDPKNKDIVYAAAIEAYKSVDGGKTWVGWKGAPGGDDYHTIWINPDNPQIILLAVDQGATITVNGGDTWSSWYNQPSAQFYHVITDNGFPYWVYGAQQESGSVGTTSRGDNGAISFRDWRTVGVEEYGYIAPDPLNPNIIYGGKITKFDKTTGQVQNISPEAVRSGKYRFLRTAPVIFSPVDPHVLYFAGNVIFKTTTGGNSWDIISPDLSRETPDVPESIGVYRRPEMAKQPRRGVIYTVAPSPRDINTIWAGTDDGLIHVTRDGGKTWQNVTPPEVTSWSKVSLMDASHFDAETAYAAINRIRLDDQRPHIMRTRDGGKTWKEIVKGLPNDPINVVREDPERRGLLFAGSERAVYVSFNDGDDWQSLRLNMAPSSVRDLVIHNDDIVVGTHGRSFWILDDITPLRQASAEIASARASLFRPQVAYRMRRNVNTDTPLPPEEPVGQNPPDGAVINYYLKSESTAPVVLEIFDQANNLVRRYSSADKPEVLNEKDFEVPEYWFRQPTVLPAKTGLQRFVWDLRYPSPKATRYSFPISANYRDTPRNPLGPFVMVGEYKLKLTIDGKSYTQTLVVKMDPRVKATIAELQQQFDLSLRAFEGNQKSTESLEQIRRLRAQIRALGERAGAMAEPLKTFDDKLVAISGEGRGPGGPGGGGPGGGGGATREATFTSLVGTFESLLGLFQEADAAPTTQGVAASAEWQQKFSDVMTRWNEVREKDLKALNDQLRQANLPVLSLQ